MEILTVFWYSLAIGAGIAIAPVILWLVFILFMLLSAFVVGTLDKMFTNKRKRF